MEKQNSPYLQIIILLGALGLLLLGLTRNTYPPPSGEILFTSHEDGDSEINVIDVASGKVRKLTDNDVSDQSPLWSSDGKKIIYSVLGQGIFVMGADGRNPVHIAFEGSANCILPSPQGDQIVFYSDNAKIVNNYVQATSQYINVISLSGGDVFRIITDKYGEGGYGICSPDGQHIAFGSQRDGNPGIYIVRVDGTGLKQLTDKSHDYSGLNWSPDGKQFVYQSSLEGYGDIFSMNSDGSNQRQLTFDPAFDINPSWSPDGKQIAFASARYNELLPELNPPTVICSDATMGTACSSHQRGAYEIYLMNVNGSNLRRLTFNQFDDGWPQWSPDGRYISFYSIRENYEFHIIG